MKPKSALRSFLALAGSSMLAISSSHAAIYFWDGTSASWNLPANWSTDGTGATDPGTVPGILDDLTFNITGANNAQNITLDANQAAKSLTFSTTGATNFRGNSSGTTARTLTLGGNITLAATAGPVTIGESSATYGAVNIIMSATQSWTNNSTSSLSVNGNVDNGGKLLTIGNGTNNGLISIGGVISGTGGITMGSQGRLVLSGVNDFTGAVAVTGSTNTGTIAFTSIANYSVASALGAAASGSFTLGNGGSEGRLEYIGTTNSESNRTIAIRGTTPTAGQIYNNGTGTLTFDALTFNTDNGTGNRSLVLGGSNTGSNEIRGIIKDNAGGVLNLTKTDIGNWVLGGDNTSGYTGSTTLNAGTLKLNYDTTANGTNTSKLSDTGALNLSGGTLELVNGSHVESVGSTTVDFGTTFIKRTGTGSTLSMGNITFTAGAVDFAAGSIATTTSSNNTSGVLSLRATVGGANYATIDTGNIVALAEGSYTGFSGTLAADTVYKLADGGTTSGTAQSQTTAGLRITTTTTGQSLALGNNFTIGSILFCGAHDYAITTSSSLRIAPSYLQNYGTGTLTLGSLGGALTQYGTGKTILNAAAGGDYGMTINGGTVQISDNLQIGTNVSATVKVITLNNGTLLASENLALDANSGGGLRARTISLGAGGGTLAAAANKTLTVSGVISGTDNPLTIGSASSNGKVILSATNTYSGPTTVTGGTLYVTGALSSSAVTVQADGTIGSNGTAGTLGQGLTILEGGNLDLTGAALGLNSTNILSITGGTLSLGNLTFQDIVGWNWANANVGTYELIDGSFAINWGSTAHLSAGTAYDFHNGKAGYFTEGSLKAVIVAIPEPNAAALLGSLGMLMLLRRRRN